MEVETVILERQAGREERALARKWLYGEREGSGRASELDSATGVGEHRRAWRRGGGGAAAGREAAWQIGP